MEIAKIYEKLVPIFHDVFDDPTIVVNDELNAGKVGGWDSLSHIRLMLTIERAYGIKFSTSEIGRLKNVGELVRLMQTKT